MKDEIHGFVSDWLHRRGIQDADGFATRAACALDSLPRGTITEIRNAISKVKTDLFRRNSGIRKTAIADELAKDIFNRLQIRTQATQSLPDKCKIVFFAANPLGTTQLNLAEECRSIIEKIRAAEFRDTIEFESAWAARPDDLLQYLNQ
jgi:hypothetical protein